MTSLAAIRQAFAALPGPNTASIARVAEREATLTKPAGSLARLEEITAWLAAWQGPRGPRAENIACHVFAGNHGVAAEGVSAFPAAVTAQMVANFEAGGAAVNQLCKTVGVVLSVTALDLGQPTASITKAPAMDEARFLRAFEAGAQSVSPAMDLLCLGEMGIGNTTAAAALCLAAFGGRAEDWTGPGTGVRGAALAAKIRAVEGAVTRHGAARDGLSLLQSLGGRELAAIAGAVLAARQKQVPVMLDGFICTAAAAMLTLENPGALDHCMVGHGSAEPGHARLLAHLGKRPLLDLGMRLGEASGAVLAAGVVKAAVACHRGMATFAEAAVATRTD